MALMTMVARVVDGLPLVGTMQDDEQVSLSGCITDDNVKLIFVELTRSLAKVFSNIRIRQKCFSENWVHNRRADVPLKQDHIYSSKLEMNKCRFGDTVYVIIPSFTAV